MGFKDIHVVEGKLNGHAYQYPNKTDVCYVKGRNENNFSANNQIDFCCELIVRVYYPSNTQSVKFSSYYPPYVARLQSSIEKVDVPGIKQKDIDDITSISTFNISDAPIAPGKFPVIIFQPGWYGCPAIHWGIKYLS